MAKRFMGDHIVHLLPGGDRRHALWVHRAVDDYAGARMCISNGLVCGAMLAQQAVEKVLKGYLRFAHPGRTKFVGGGAQMLRGGVVAGVGYGHDLVAHADLVDRAFPDRQLLPRHEALLHRLSLDFEQKYPDGPKDEAGTSRLLNPPLDVLDALLIPLLVNYPLDLAVGHRTGLYWVYHLLTDPRRAHHYWATSHWVARGNEELQRHMPLLAANYAKGKQRDQELRMAADRANPPA